MMTEIDSVSARFEAGEEIEVIELVSRMNELESAFEDRGFEYIAVNGWLVTALDADKEARELMMLRGTMEKLGEIEGTVVLAGRAGREDGAFLCELSGRYVPNGEVFHLSAPSTAPASGI